MKVFLTTGPREFIAYQNDIRIKRAVERNIEIIGEAMNRIMQRDKSIQLTNSRKIVDVRNRIIHGYDTVSDDIIWGIVIRHYRSLKLKLKITYRIEIQITPVKPR